MSYTKYLFLGLLCILSFSCKEEDDPNEVLNPSDKYNICNSRLSACTNGNGEYCLFGFKWGETPSFAESGYDGVGPQISGGIVTYSFQDMNGLVNTHAQIDLPSKSFDVFPECTRTELKKAFDSWEQFADIEFKEESDNSDSDIRIFVADIKQTGVGNPNFQETPCTILSGQIVLKTGLAEQDCNFFYLVGLHEIGHALGLGHVGTPNIMSPTFFQDSIYSIRAGDIKGIRAIYGLK